MLHDAYSASLMDICIKGISRVPGLLGQTRVNVSATPL